MDSRLTQRLLPNAPANLTSSNVTASSVDLSWDEVGIASGYQVYQDGVAIDTTTEPTYSVTGLTTATAYEFYVTALDSTYNTESQPSNTVNVTTA